MTLDECEVGKTYKIENIYFCDNALKSRFISFGITKNTIFKLLHSSTKKSTFSIHIGQSQIALRNHEAKHIEVKSIPQ